MMNILLYGVTLTSYGILSAMLWYSYTSLNKYCAINYTNTTARNAFPIGHNLFNNQTSKYFPQDSSIASQATLEKALPEHIYHNRLSCIERIVLTIALFCHGLLLDQTIFSSGLMVFGFAYAISAMLWLGLTIYWVETFFFPIRSMALILFPAAFIAVLLPTLFGGISMMNYAISYLFKTHFIIAIIAYGFLSIAALHALLMLFVEHRLHSRYFSASFNNATHLQKHNNKINSLNKQQTSISSSQVQFQTSTFPFFKPIWNLILITLPPLLTMERLLFRLILAGFIMLSATLISGGLVQKYSMHNWIEWNEKTIFSVLSWLMFAYLLIGRQWRGWRGRTALHWTLIAYGLLLLAYIGSRFIFEVWL